MDLKEYKSIENYDYNEYVNYLQAKYGIPKKSYFTLDWRKNTDITRTKEGLYIHHVKENKTIMLCNPDYAKNMPFEYQNPENLVYCDLLEHLLLHILICEEADINSNEIPGIGGVQNFIIPQLNDVYSGYISSKSWERKCYNKIINDKDVYYELIARFVENCNDYPLFNCNNIFISYKYHENWNSKNNIDLYNELNNKVLNKIKYKNIVQNIMGPEEYFDSGYWDSYQELLDSIIHFDETGDLSEIKKVLYNYSFTNPDKIINYIINELKIIKKE